jgi:hypothetical protein
MADGGPAPPQSATVLVAIYSEAARRLRAELLNAVISGPRRNTRERIAQLARIERIIDDLRKHTRGLSLRVIRDAYLAGLNYVDRRLGGRTKVDDLFALNTVHADAVGVIARELDGRLDSSLRTVGRQARDIYRQVGLEEAAIGIIRGQPRREISASVKRRLVAHGVSGFVDRADRHWQLDVYARMVARTSSREAMTVATAQRLMEGGHDLIQISTHPHPHDVCTPFDGKVFSLTGETPGFPRVTKLPPFHPNAIVEGTRFESMGAVRNGTRSAWNGPLVELTTHSGIRLPIGPNHPVPTPRGWVAAKFLREGDYVLRAVEGEGMGTPRRPAPLLEPPLGLDHDLDQMEARVEGVFDALQAVGETTTVAASPAYFYGDGNFCEGEIDVVWADGFLPQMQTAEVDEPECELIFIHAGAELEPFASQGSFASGLGGRRDSIRRSLPDGDSALAEASEQGGGAERATFGEILRRFAGQVATDEIVEVGYVDNWRGHAFDFETTTGLYLGNRMVISNCKHVATPAKQTLEIAKARLEVATSREDVERALGVRFPRRKGR